MSVGPSGIVGSVAGSQLPQVTGSEAQRAQQESADQARSSQSADKAEAASGLGETEEDQQASDRDADGRRLWEPPASGSAEEEAQEESPDEPTSRDTDPERGANLDLTA